MSARGSQIAYALARAYVRALGASWFGFDSTAFRITIARELRMAFERLGPTFVKIGQLVSVRPDLFSPEIVFEMERLQDRVAPVAGERVRAIVEREFGRPVAELFESFDDAPIAAASIAQVHRAILSMAYRPAVGEILPEGTPLAVKVVRPGIEEAIRADIALARPMIGQLARLPRLRRYNLLSFLDGFADTLASECDLRIEAAVADRHAFDFRDDALMVVPRVVWSRTTRHVLTTEFVEGWRLSDLDEAHRSGIDARALAVHGAEVFLRQVLEIGRFHADLHPANLFVTPDGRICYLDFGIVGTTTSEQRLAIAQVLAATVYGDADRALRYSAELGLVVPEESRARVRDRVAHLMGETLGATPRDVRGFAIGFLRVMDEERVHVPEGYGLLIKALVTVEGVARALYPDIDITEEAKPFATKVIARSIARPEVLWSRLPDAARAALRVLVQ